MNCRITWMDALVTDDIWLVTALLGCGDSVSMLDAFPRDFSVGRLNSRSVGQSLGKGLHCRIDCAGMSAGLVGRRTRGWLVLPAEYEGVAGASGGALGGGWCFRRST